jgi:hypothetical protein
MIKQLIGRVEKIILHRLILILILVLIQAPEYGVLNQRRETTCLNSFIQRGNLGADVSLENINAIVDGCDCRFLDIDLGFDLGDFCGLFIGFKFEIGDALIKCTL